MLFIATKPGASSGCGVTIGVEPLTVDPETLYGAVPPVISTLKVELRLAHVTVWLLGFATSAGGGAVGGAIVPSTLFNVAVVCRPIASTIENTRGFTQVPLVITLNGCPLASTVELRRSPRWGRSS